MSAATAGVRDLLVAYQGRPALQGLSGDFEAGALNAVVGPNGSGKSTLMAVLAGELAPTQGEVRRPPPRQIAYLVQASAIDRSFPISAFDLAAMGLWPQLGSFRALGRPQQEAVSAALAAVGLAGHERRLIGELSVGQLQRVRFARAMLQDAALILLDEPFNALDASTQADLLALLQRWRDEGRTVIAVLHELELVRAVFEYTLLLARAPVAWGPTAQVLSEANLARARQLALGWGDAPACELRGSMAEPSSLARGLAR